MIGKEAMQGRTRLLILALAALVLGGIFGGAASQALARPHGPAPRVLSPRDGHRLPSRPVLVKVYLGSAKLVAARLNGRRIGDDLGRGRLSAPCTGTPAALTRGAICKLRASPTHGLKYGRNVLRARFKRHGRFRVREVHFRVARHRPLAAAGRDRYTVPGSRIHLNGRRSLLPAWLRQRLAHSGTRARPHFRWRLVHAPRASNPVRGGLAGAHTRTPTMRLDSTATGAYKFRLTVTAPGGRSGTDSVTVRSANEGGAGGVDAAPLVGVDTMTTYHGDPGIEIDTYRDIPVSDDCPQRIAPSLTEAGIGAGCFYPDPGQGQLWLQMLVLNRQNLSVIDNKPFNCPQATDHPQEHDFDFLGGGDAYYNNQNPCIRELVNYVNTLNGNALVIAVNQPGLVKSNKQVQPPVGVGAALSGKFIQPFDRHNLGINASGWFDAPDNGAHLAPAVRGTFSAIGVPGWKTGGARGMPDDPGTWDEAGAGRLQTNIAVDNRARYGPFDPVSADESHSPLVNVLTKKPTPWPTATTGQAAAMSAIADSVGMTQDPRSFYYSAPDDENWGADLGAIDHLQPSDFPSLDPADFHWAQDRLHTEVFDITKVHTYVGALAEPFSTTESTIWASFGQVIANVNNATSNGTGAKVWAGAKDVFESLVDLIPGAGSVFKWSDTAVFGAGALIAVYHTGMDFAELASEPADSAFQVDAADLGNTLTTRLNEAEEELRVRFFNIIVADWGKLQTVALCSGTTPSAGCDDPQKGWSFTKNSVANLETFLKMGFQRDLYTELVPARYPLALGLTPVSQSYAANGIDAANWCRPIPPFEHTTGVYQWQTVDQDYWSDERNHVPSDWAITPIVLTAGDPGYFGTWQSANWTVFGRMFDSIDGSGDFGKGGLAIDEDEFMRDNYGVSLNRSGGHFLYAPEVHLGCSNHWN